MTDTNQRRIYFVEDNKYLLDRAVEPLQRAGMELCIVDLHHTLEIPYWASFQLTPQDIVIVDLNLSQEEGVKCSGIDVLRKLQEGKEKRQLAGLEKVLVATSMEGYLHWSNEKSPPDNIPKKPHPDIGLLRPLSLGGFNIYGLQTGIIDTQKIGLSPESKTLNVDDYVRSLIRKIKGIYEGKETILNE